ncbi:MAG TPA: pilus assembly protein TadG-related protein [Pyrinomonadaceae bacterium]|nr:pilus assembly protein TadG-related protein [Pyrinomonadaceae bacterium]
MQQSGQSQNGERRNGERGSVLVVSTFGMLALLLATGLCIDISHLYLVRSELQNAADAAALAGASALNSDDGGITKAADYAVQSLNSYEFNKKAVAIPRANVLFAKNLDGPYVGEAVAKGQARNIRFVKVVVPPAAVSTSFAAPVLGASRNVAAAAQAGMSVPLNRVCDYIPVTVIDSEPTYFLKGQTYTIRRPPGGAVTPGNYQILSIDYPGGNDDRYGLGRGVRNCIGAGGYVQTKPGVTSGAVRQGINTRFGDYGSGLNPSEYPPDENVRENINYQQYLDAQQARDAKQTPASGTFQSPTVGSPMRNRRVVLIPIILKSEFDSGRDSVRIDRFAAFFLQTRIGGGNGGEIVVEYIEMRLVVGRGGYDPDGGTPSPELSIPVIYR